MSRPINLRRIKPTGLSGISAGRQPISDL
jgi:hypothetical protein